MEDKLIADIKEFIACHRPPKLASNAMLSGEDFRRLGYTPRELFPIASMSDVVKAEANLGFDLPPLITRLFLEVSNGISGFAYDIIGLHGGCSSDSGTLVESYLGFRAADDYRTGPWKCGMLPFCNWGCAIYSCVDCLDTSYPVFTYEDSGVWPERYSLLEFFEMWLSGSVAFSGENVELLTKEGTNPFTGEKMTIRGQRRGKLES